MKGATPSATREHSRHFESRGHSPDAYRVLGRTGLTVSALGFGAYRVDDRNPEHRAALVKALEAGCNLIDTSTNYTDGESESCIGSVLQGLESAREGIRSRMVTVSKIGYVQGQNLGVARSREEAGTPFPEMVKISEGCWHCIHPRFIEDQLDRSLSRLRSENLDVCLLHNPEYFLSQNRGRHAGEKTGQVREEFYGRVQAAFVQFEREVKRGRILWYGVSSNSFGAPTEDPESTSLGRMWEVAGNAAREIGLAPEEHHFAVAQLPLNLFEHGPLTVQKEGNDERHSALALAAERSIGVLVNRPLNAFARGELVRLADFPAISPAVSMEEGLRRVSVLEEEFLQTIGSKLPKRSTELPVENLFNWGSQLSMAVGRFGGYEQWQSFQEQHIHPHLYHAVSALRGALPPEKAGAFQEWLDRYLPEMGHLLEAFRADSARRSQARSREIASLLDPILPPDLRPSTLSRKALHVVASAEGVTCVLNGMRHPHYVDDSTKILKWSRLASVKEIFDKF